MSNINGSRLKILAMLFLFVPQESWDLQLRKFGYITCGFPRIFGYVLQVIKYSISVPLDRGGFGGWNLMLTQENLEQILHVVLTQSHPSSSPAPPLYTPLVFTCASLLSARLIFVLISWFCRSSGSLLLNSSLLYPLVEVESFPKS